MREINLLPPARRKALQRESLLVTLSAFADSIIMGLSIMTLVVVGLSAILWGLSQQAASATGNDLESAVTQYTALRQEVAKQNNYLSSITDLGKKRIVWSDFLHKLNGAIPKNIYINTISGRIAAGDAKNSAVPGVAQASIEGEAPSRDALIAFQNVVRMIPGVDGVISPPSNILLRFNPTFKLDINFKSF